MQDEREKPLKEIISGHSTVQIYEDRVLKIFRPDGYVFALREMACYMMAHRVQAGSIGTLVSWRRASNGNLILEFPKYSTTLKNYNPKYPDVSGLAQHVICMLFEMHCQMHVLHRDLKPQNIMLDKTGRVLCIDFSLGLACSEISPDPSDWKKYTARVVTRWYRPPELLKASAQPKNDQDRKLGFGTPVPYNGSCDVWSMGLVLLELKLPTVFSDVFMCDDERSGYDALELHVKSGAWLARSDMEEFAKTNPFLYDLIIDRMLVWDPTKRATAFELMQLQIMKGIERDAVPIEEIWMQDHIFMQRNTAGRNLAERAELINTALMLAGPNPNFSSLVEIIDYVASSALDGYKNLDVLGLYSMMMAAMGYTDYDRETITRFPACLGLDLGPFIRASPLKLAVHWDAVHHLDMTKQYITMAQDMCYPVGNKMTQIMQLIGSGKQLSS